MQGVNEKVLHILESGSLCLGVLMLWLEEAWKAHPAPSWVLPTESLRCTSAVLPAHRTKVARPEYVQG